jgi:NADH-quinone oxidoreductase subunit A
VIPGETAPLWPLAVHVAAAVIVVTAMLGLSHFLGQRGRNRADAEPFESGVVSTGSARVRLSARYYLLAMFFVVFDLEVVFIVAWAVAARELGWAGYAGMAVFTGVLLAALAYLWRLGALDWGRATARKPAKGTESCDGH